MSLVDHNIVMASVLSLLLYMFSFRHLPLYVLNKNQNIRKFRIQGAKPLPPTFRPPHFVVTINCTSSTLPNTTEPTDSMCIVYHFLSQDLAVFRILYQWLYLKTVLCTILFNKRVTLKYIHTTQYEIVFT